MPTESRALCILLLAALSACDETSPRADAGAPDAAVDGGGPVTCDVAAPVVGGTPETDALADDPARCGQLAHAWLRSEELGAIVSMGEPSRFARTVLGATAAGLDYVLPRAPEHNVQARVITYRTQDRGTLLDATALLAYPEQSEPGVALPVLLFLHGTQGFTDGCSASDDVAYRTLVALFASWGFLVVAPDYIGLRQSGETGFLHPYLVGQSTAIGSIDAVRAALRVDAAERGGACGQARFATYGASQGGHAALWVDRLAPYYARELEHAGLVAAVPPADLDGEFTRALSELVPSTGNTTAFFGAAADWYGLEGRLDEVFVSPWDVDVPTLLASDCSPDVDPPSALGDIFTTELMDAASADTLADFGDFGCIVRENGLLETSVARAGDDASSYGVLFLTGEDDGLVHTPIEREAFTTLCDAGLPASYLECAAAPHAEGAIWALPETLDFLEARLAGEAFERPASCAAPAPSRCRGTPDGS